METDRMIRELRGLSDKHRADIVNTFGVRWSDVCRDCADKIEELNNELIKLKGELNNGN